MTHSRFNIFLERVFNVKQHELPYVKLLFFHNFFQGIGLALFFTVASAIFVSRFFDQMPQAYILTALTLFAIGIVYSQLEQHFAIKKLLRTIMILIFSSVILLRFSFTFFEQSIIIAFVTYIWYKASALLNNLEFWGVSSHTFNVRQSKRLFGLVSGGEETAKLIGYFSISFLVPFLGIENLLLISAASFFISFLILNSLLSKQSLENPAESSPVKDQMLISEDTKKDSLLKRYLRSDFIILLSVLSFLAVISFTFIDFSFLSNVRAKFQTKEEIAYFFALFFGTSKAFTFVFKLFLSGRMIDFMGVKKALLFLPSSFLILFGITISLSFLFPENPFIFWIFAFIMLFSEIFRYSLNDPVFFSLFQPLSKHLRLFGHAVVNGFLNPIALAIAGASLYLIIKINNGVDLQVVSIIVFLFLLGWITIVIITNRQYIIVLQDAVKKRTFEGSELSIKGKLVYDIIFGRLNSPFPEEAIYSFELLLKTNPERMEEGILLLLNHPEEKVKIYALEKIEVYKLKALKDITLEIIENTEYNSKIREAAINAYCLLEESAYLKMSKFLNKKDPLLIKGAISGLLKNGELEGVVAAGEKLLKLIQSKNPSENQIATEIIGILKIKNFFQPILEFLELPDHNLKLSAIEAAGKIQSPKFLPVLFSLLSDKYFSKAAVLAIVNYKEDALDIISSKLDSAELEKADRYLLSKYCQIAGMIGGPKAHTLLLRLINFPSIRIQNEVITALKKSHYKTKSDDELLKEKFDSYFNQASWLFGAIYLAINEKVTNQELINAIELELNSAKENIFNILSFQYDTRTIFRAKEGLLAGYSDKKANAFEIIDNLISKKLSSKMSLIMEDIPLPERIKKLTGFQPQMPQEILEVILTIIKEKEKKFSRWTQVIAIETIRKQKLYDYIPQIVPFIQSNYKILREVTLLTLQEFAKRNSFSKNILANIVSENIINQLMSESIREESLLLEVEKVIILKSTSLFTETPETILVDVASIIKEERVDAGTTIFHKGDMGYCMYIISEGEINIHDKETTFAVLRNRDFFGELALLDPEPRSASATALTDSILLRLDQDAFYELMSERLEVAKGILKILCRRLRNQNQKITELQTMIN